ncbi:MAG TPA: hypothetical protein ENN03_08000 [bacterium]|nr:hypothetical protein [bacterium]
MLQHIRRLTHHSLVYGIGHIMSRFLGFLLLPIHTHVLPPDVYRTPALLFSSLAILNVLFSYGMDVAFLRYFILEKNLEAKKRIFSTAFWMIGITGLVFSGLIFLFPKPMSILIFEDPAWTGLIRLAAGILLADALCLLPFLVLRAEEKSLYFVIIKTVNIIMNLALNALFVVNLRRGVEGIFEANLVASVLTLILLLPLLFRWLRIHFRVNLLRELLHFGLPYVPSGLAIIIMDQIGRFFLDRIQGKAEAGLFSANYKLGMFMALLVAAFRFAWHPFFLSIAEKQEAPRVYARVLTYFLLIAGWILLGVSLFIEEIISIHVGPYYLMGKGFGQGTVIVPLILAAYAAYGVYVNLIVGVYIRKKTLWLPLVTGAGALVAVVSNLLLVPMFSIQGAAWATLLAYATMAGCLFIVNQRLFHVPYEGWRFVHVVVITGILFWTGWTLDFPVWGRAILVAGYWPLFMVTGFLNHEEREWIKDRFLGGVRRKT